MVQITQRYPNDHIPPVIEQTGCTERERLSVN